VFDLAGPSGSCRLKIARYDSTYSSLDRTNGGYSSHNSCCHYCEHVGAQSLANEEHAIVSFDCVGGWHELSEHSSPTCHRLVQDRSLKRCFYRLNTLIHTTPTQPSKYPKATVSRHPSMRETEQMTPDPTNTSTCRHCSARCAMLDPFRSNGNDSNMRALCSSHPPRLGISGAGTCPDSWFAFLTDARSAAVHAHQCTMLGPNQSSVP
jgi:hypothetical protein